MIMSAENSREENRDLPSSGSVSAAGSEPDPRVAELQDRLLRALADAENARKRAERSRAEGRKEGVVEVVTALIPALDSLELALASIADAGAGTDEQKSSLLCGLVATQRSFATALEQFGIERIYPFGERFDAALHEAVATRAQPGKQPGEVLEVMQAGYRLGERLLRPARVTVAAPSAPQPESDSAA
ncbi:MAG: nucleotide exchange factor GrpE [Roseibium sp.]